MINAFHINFMLLAGVFVNKFQLMKNLPKNVSKKWNIYKERKNDVGVTIVETIVKCLLRSKHQYFRGRSWFVLGKQKMYMV